MAIHLEKVFNELETENPLAYDILRDAALLDPDVIPEILLYDGPKPDGFEAALDVLIQKRLIKRNKEKETYAIKESIQKTVRALCDG